MGVENGTRIWFYKIKLHLNSEYITSHTSIDWSLVGVENGGVGFYGILVHHLEYNPPLRLAEEMIGLSVWVENRWIGFYGILVHHREYNPPLRLAEEMIGLCSVWVENRWVGFYGIPVHLTVSTTIHFNAFQNRLLFWVVFKIVGLGSTEFWYISSWPHHSRRWVQESMALLVLVVNRWVGFYGILVHLTEYNPPLLYIQESIALLGSVRVLDCEEFWYMSP